MTETNSGLQSMGQAPLRDMALLEIAQICNLIVCANEEYQVCKKYINIGCDVKLVKR